VAAIAGLPKADGVLGLLAMPNTDPRVDAYLAAAPAYARPILAHLRALVHRACPEATEDLKWRMPSFQYHGILCGMAAFKAHAVFGFWHQGMRAIVAADGYDGESGMNSLGRLTSVKDLPPDKTLLRYVREAMKLNASGAPSRPASKTRKPLAVPADLTVLLKKNAKAGKAFANMPPSHQHEYIEWITEAKRPETREKRLATTLDWLTQGKSRNWKYEKC
jgi:hypothetical protein